MTIGKKLLWGSLGWVLGGPIGAVLGYTFASMDNGKSKQSWGGTRTFKQEKYPRTKPGDFIVSLLVLFAKVMKADKKLLKSEEHICSPPSQPLVDLAEVRSIELDINRFKEF